MLNSLLQRWLLRGCVVRAAEQADGIGSAMAYNFLACDRDQAFLLPPDPRDWLPADHLAWFVLDVVDHLTLARSSRPIGLMGMAGAPTSPGCSWPYCCTATGRDPLLAPDRAPLPGRHRLPNPGRQHDP